MHRISAVRVPRTFKAVALFIGTSIGAGFSTGREIALFFGDASPLNVAFSAVFTALLCFLFMSAGKNNLIPRTPAVQFFIAVAALISLCAMLAGSELILHKLTTAPLLGLLFAVAGAIIVVAGIEKIKFLNTICVPLILIMIAVLFFMTDNPEYSSGFLFFKPLLYSGLDVLLAGVVISDEGKDMTYKQIGLSSVLICILMFVILYMLQSVVLTDTSHSAMPVYTIASALGVKWVCGLLISAAIFTTLVSSLHVATEKVRYFTERFDKDKFKANKLNKISVLAKDDNRAYVVFGILLFSYPISFLGFETIVDYGYPFVSACGVGFTALILIKFIILTVQKNKLKKEFKSRAATAPKRFSLYQKLVAKSEKTKK